MPFVSSEEKKGEIEKTHKDSKKAWECDNK